MKKVIKIFVLFCFTTLIISGCGSNDSPVKRLCRVVTQVDISCQREHMHIARHYTDNKKMQSVLLYLRLLQPGAAPESAPNLLKKDIFEITVHLSDGKKRIYRQTGHRYFSMDSRPWQMIKPEDAHKLYTLLRQLPGDPPVYQISPESEHTVSCAQLFAKSTISSGYPLCTNCSNFSNASTNTCIFVYFLYNGIDKIV